MTIALSASSPPTPSGPTLWLMAARPRTLVLSVVPVLVGTAIASAQGASLHWLAAIAALIGAMLIQIGTNLHNDVSDFERGGDGPNRVGPTRVTAQGYLTAAQVKRAVVVCFALAGVAGLFLVYVGGWPILILGLVSLFCGWAYTGGPCPISYTPLGELFALIFFGLGAVAGTAWLHMGMISLPAVIGGIAVGLFASGVLLVNNHRDVESDAGVGRHTLALLAGQRLTVVLYGLFMATPFILLPVLGAYLPSSHTWLAFGALPVAGRLVWRFATEPKGRGFNAILAETGQAQAVYGLLLCLGLVW